MCASRVRGEQVGTCSESGDVTAERVCGLYVLPGALCYMSSRIVGCGRIVVCEWVEWRVKHAEYTTTAMPLSAMQKDWLSYTRWPPSLAPQYAGDGTLGVHCR